MKKLLLTFGLLLACVFSFSQIIQPKTTPNFQQFGSPQTWTQTNGISYPVLGLVNSEYADTVSANLIPYVKNAPGVQIRIGDNIWLRSYDAKKWLLIPTQGIVVDGDSINYLVDVNRPPGQLNVYGKFFNGVNSYERLMYTDSIGSGGGSSYTFTAPLNESGGVVDLGGLSGFGTAGQTIRTTGSAFQYSDKLTINSNGNVHIKDTLKVNTLSPLPIDESDFEIAVFPDLQNMIRFATAHSRTMFQWLKDSISSANVKAMLQVGDITDWNTQTEYDTLLAQLNLVTSTHPNFPYLFIPGNHDYAGGFSPAGRDSTNYNANLGVAHYSGKPFYGGHYGVSNENFFITFEAGTRKYLALGLEFFPRDVVVDWASNILDSVYAADPTREVMVVTHSYIDQRGERAVDSSTASTTVYGMTADNSGQELWDKLVRKKPNIRWVFSGHHIISGTKANKGLSKHIVSVGDNGNMVNQIFVNYQDDVNWGNGYFMRLQFKPSQNIVDVKYYSSLYDAYDTRPESAQSFALENPNIDLKSSLAIKRDLSVGRDLRVAGKAKVENLLPMRFVFSDSDHVLRDTNMVILDRTAGAGTVKIEGAINATKKVATDTSHLNYLRVMSRVNGLGKIYGNAPGLAPLYVQDVFDVGTSSSYSLVADIRQTVDSIHKLRKGAIFRAYKNNSPVDAGAGVNYTPENGSGGFLTRWYLKAGTHNIASSTDFHSSNVSFFLNHGATEDGATFNFGTNVITGTANIFARQDFTPGSARVTTTNGMLSNFSSYYKLTRASTSETNWLNHYAVAATGGTDLGQIVKTMVGLYIEPMQTGFTRRLWGVLQTGSTETHNALNNLMVGGDTTVANNLGAKLFVDGSVAIKDGTEGLGKVLTSDANGFATWETPSGGGDSVDVNNGLVKNSSGVVGLDSNGVNPLTRNVLIDADGNDFILQNASSISLESNDGGDNGGTIELQPTQIQLQVEESGAGSNIIYMNKDSTKFQFFKGQANIDSLREASNMTNKAVMVWEKTTGRWERIDKDSVGGGGSPLFPLTGTGTATGNIIGDLDGNSLSIQQGGKDFLLIDPTVNNEMSGIAAYNMNGNGNFGNLYASTTDVEAETGIEAVNNNSSKMATVYAFADTTESTLSYTADSHTFNGTVTMDDLSGTGSRAVLADGDGLLSAPVSDRNLKQNIAPLYSALQTIMQLNPVTFEYKAGWERYGSGTQVGFIAQDIEKLLPNSTYRNKKGEMGYNEIDLVPLLVKALQEQQVQIEKLQAIILNK